MHNVPSDPSGAGVCAFASRDINKAEVICEYEGEHISLEEAEIREKRYEEGGRPCALMVIEIAGHQIAWVLILQYRREFTFLLNLWRPKIVRSILNTPYESCAIVIGICSFQKWCKHQILAFKVSNFVFDKPAML